MGYLDLTEQLHLSQKLVADCRLVPSWKTRGAV